MLSDRHYQDLKSSGLSDETIAQAGFRSVDSREARDVLGFHGGAGLLIPYQNGNGKCFARIKPDEPFKDESGRLAKYLSPKDSINHLYIPPQYTDADLRNTKKAVVITEGEKKALKGAESLESFLVIGLGGVWNFKTKDRPVIEEIAKRIRWEDRIVYVCYDSDVVKKPEVQNAERELAFQLNRLGAEVSICRLPGLESNFKVGLDDYLIRHSSEEFCNRVLEHALLWTPRQVIEIENAIDFRAREIQFEEDVIAGGILPSRGIGFISAYSKMGKSIFAMNMGIAAASGRAFLNQFKVTRPTKILYLNEEISPVSMQKRVRKMFDSAEREGYKYLDNFFLVNMSGIKIDQDQGLKTAMRLIRQTNAKVVFWDCLYRFHNKIENKAEDMQVICDKFDYLRRTFGVAHVIIHHHGNPTPLSEREGFQLMRGSTVLGAYGDSYFTLTRYKKCDPQYHYQRLNFNLRNEMNPEDIVVARNPESLWYEVVGEQEIQRQPGRPGPNEILGLQNVIFCLKEMGGRATKTELLLRLEIEYSASRRTGERIIMEALVEKRIECVIEGKHHIYKTCQ